MFNRIVTILFIFFCSFSFAYAGSAGLGKVIFIDYSQSQTGALSFKDARVKNQDISASSCWGYVDSIHEAYITNIPQSVSKDDVLLAVKGDKQVLKKLRQTLNDRYEQIYVFVPNEKETQAYIYGIALYNNSKIYRSKSVSYNAGKLLNNKTLSARLCEVTDLVKEIRKNGI